MDCMEDQQPKFKHYCRVCKKGFLCGRALGGHMRAHGIGDEGGNLDDDDPVSDWEDKFGGGNRTCNRRMYQLRTNPNRLKSCRVCENCGKEFSSWKSFLEHGKCSSDDAESLVSSPGSDGEYEGSRKGCQQWSKRKRSLRTNVGSFCSTYPSSEDEDLLLAKCLVDLANARVEVEPEESCASASKEEERRINPVAAYFNAPLASRAHLDKTKGASKGLFECKACKKVFNSHQALGGHRASHKKVKGCYAAKQDQQDDSLADDDVTIHDEFFPSKSFSSLQFEQGPTIAGASRRKSKVHECTICHRVFSTGQALGGHKRCHWITSNSQETSSLVKLQFHDHMDSQIVHQGPAIIKSETLDLNIPATQGHDHNVTGILRRDPQNPFSFEVSTDIHLHTWITNLDTETKRDTHNCHHQNINDDRDNENDNSDDIKINQNNNIISSNVGPTENEDDEADSKVELGKLSDLKDINLSGSSSQWLQVGIGSTADVTAKP